MRFWSPLEELNAEVIAEGGFVNAHSHLDRAYTVSPKMMARTKEHLFEKWELVDEIKKNRSVGNYAQGITTALDMQAWYGVSHVCSFIDIDEVVGHRALDGAVIAKNSFDAVKLIIACQTLKGVIDPKSYGLIESRIDDIDIVGSLPGADKGRESKHLDIVMNLAKRNDKMLHVHVDQLNTPDEKETELLCRKTIEHGLEGKVVAVHSISLAAHHKAYRNEVYRMAKDAGMMFISCPSAWIDHPRTERLVPFHNAVTPVDELLENDLIVAIGSDNICDIYKPFSDGDLSVEMRFLLESCKIYDMPTLKKISRENGLKVCNA